MKWIGWLCLLALSLGCQTEKNTPTSPPPMVPTENWIPAFAPEIQYLGLMDRTDTAGVRFSWTGSQIRFRVAGATALHLHLPHTPLAYAPPDSLPWPIFFTLLVDGVVRDRIQVLPDSDPYLLNSLTDADAHTIELFRETEASAGIITFAGITLLGSGQLLPPPALPDRYLAFWGNSLTAGYGNLGDGPNCPFDTETENGYLAYGAIAARSLDAAYTSVCYSGKGIWRNYDQTLDETIYHLRDRYWPGPDKRRHDLSGPAPDAIVINLGTNDFAFSNPPEEAFVTQYRQLITHLHQAYPDAVFFLLSGSALEDSPPSYRRSTLGRYLDAIAEATKTAGIEVYRFDQTRQGALGYGCDWHPSLAQHELNAEELSAFIGEKMGWE